MTDRVRCTCKGRGGRREWDRVNPQCPLHGAFEPEPVLRWKLTDTDRNFLRALRIRAEDA